MRVVRLSFTARDGTALRVFLARARPVYEALPGIELRLWQDIHQPDRYVEEIRYASHSVHAADERRLSDDPQMRALIAEWHGLIEGLSVTTLDDVTADLGRPAP